jgi:hypothetical protein
LREAEIDLDDVFRHFVLLQNLISPIDATESNNVFVAKSELVFILMADQPFSNYLKGELVLAELLKQMYPNNENTFLRIIECDTDNNPDDTRSLIVKFVNSYTPKYHFLDPGIKKPRTNLDYRTLTLEAFNKNNKLKIELFDTMRYELNILPYLQYDEEQLDLFLNKLLELQESINERLNRSIENSLALVLTHCYIALKKDETPREFLIDIFDSLLSKPEGDLMKKLNRNIQNLINIYNSRPQNN